MPRALHRSNSSRSSSTSRMRLKGTPCFTVEPSLGRHPFKARSSMKPALPSKPTALPTSGASKNLLSSAASKALRMVPSVLLEMIPNDAPSALRLFNLGPSMAARSQSSSCLVLRAARSPGVAVNVPSKSKKITATPAAGSMRKSSRKGLGDSGLSNPVKFSDFSDSSEDKADSALTLGLALGRVWELLTGSSDGLQGASARPSSSSTDRKEPRCDSDTGCRSPEATHGTGDGEAGAAGAGASMRCGDTERHSSAKGRARARDRPVGDAEEDVASTEPPSCGALPQELEEVHHGAKVVHGGFF
mmetsp:Transcript_66973/g.146806  ORF Transcript_66973/g.146806 Transcript_66973/m.146806 type:complete len:303 (+) Transcript_66973:502-1410(+)